MKLFYNIIIIIILLSNSTLQSNAQSADSYFEEIQLTRIISNGLYGLRNNNKIIIPCEFNEMYPFNPFEDKQRYHYYICVSKYENYDVKKGVYDIYGKVIVPCIYDKITFNLKCIHVCLNEKEGLYSYDGKELYPTQYQSIHTWEKVIRLEKNNCVGFADYNGSIIVPCEYSYAFPNKDGTIFLVNRNGFCKDNNNYSNEKEIIGGKWGYYANGKEIIPCQYDKATNFENDVATVIKNGQVKLIKNPLKHVQDIQIAESNAPINKNKQRKAISNYPSPSSDVDKNIPRTKQNNYNSFAFIIANENYPYAPVPFSLNDGRIFKEYCNKTLGLPSENIYLYEDATYGMLVGAIEKMKDIANSYEGDASIIFYYSGHGFPDEKHNTAYLLPVDGDATAITETGYGLAKLYKEISMLKTKTTLVLLDACFSGAKREDDMLSSARGVAIKVKEETPQGNLIVFTAAQGDETAHQIEEKGHGLFTYYLLKELQQTCGKVKLGEFTDYVTKQVKRQSVVVNSKKQTPTVIPSQNLVSSWRNLNLTE